MNSIDGGTGNPPRKIRSGIFPENFFGPPLSGIPGKTLDWEGRSRKLLFGIRKIPGNPWSGFSVI
nr:MAG TPA: hypothetical protein [Caudoviricetes sp.]